MTRQEYAELLSGNRPIQQRMNLHEDKWVGINWEAVDKKDDRQWYRYKPETIYKPYKFSEFSKEYKKRRKQKQVIFFQENITPYVMHFANDKGVSFIPFLENKPYFNSEPFYYTYSDILKFCKWSDGSPCGCETTI